MGESKVSEILTFFLNPNALYGQGDVFLKLFIEKFHIKFHYSNISEVFTKVEKRTDYNRRLDIYLMSKSSGDTIGIENKIFISTKDQVDQINDYINYLSRITKGNKFVFIYLAQKDKAPSKHSYNVNRLVNSNLDKNV